MSDFRIGRFQVLGTLGQGAHSTLLHIHRSADGRNYALKVVPIGGPEDLKFLEQARHEFRVAQMLDHKNLIKIYALEENKDWLFRVRKAHLLIEYVNGKTLDTCPPLPLPILVQVFKCVAEGLVHMHRRKVYHADLKPNNIMLSRAGDVKIIDYGLATIQGEGKGRLQGTPEYMAPEQLWGREVDPRTDVYAVGMSLYECLTGEVPYTGSYPEVLVQVSNAARPADVRERCPDVPPALAVVIEHALEKDPSARFASAAELGRALLAASGLQAGRSALLSTERDAVDDDEESERAIKLVKRKAPRAGERPSAPGPPPPPARRHARAPYVTPVLLTTPAGIALTARSEEISEEGMLVVVPTALPLDALLQLRFASPGTGEMVTVGASVRWTREARGGRNAIGVEFVDVPQPLRQAVGHYVVTPPAASG